MESKHNLGHNKLTVFFRGLYANVMQVQRNNEKLNKINRPCIIKVSFTTNWAFDPEIDLQDAQKTVEHQLQTILSPR